MNKFILSAAVALAIPAAAFADDKIVNPDSTGFQFTDVEIVKTTPVKDQNKSGTCWCFAGNAFFEDEILRTTGKEVDLSEMFVVRQCYLDKAIKYIRMGGTINFAQGGSGLDVPYVWKKYGAMPEEAFAGLNYGEAKHSHYEMFDVMEGYLKGVLRNGNKKLSTAWLTGFEAILDAYFGKVPETFEYNGKTYTPRSFADEMGLDMEDYIPVTSWTHHPFYEMCPVEVADNWLWGQYYNVKMEEMKEIVDNSLERGYSLVWAADVSEPGFKWYQGYALLPEAKSAENLDGSELSRWVQLSDKDREAEMYEITGPTKEQTVTQESRQIGFDNLETTDDHGMTIMGKAVDQEGNRYYKVKNSWDTN
ncbi:MAG: aminopeptidase, partial [Muribaculaceae bacterium]|nr:aminopeptidase [Muribaculaceae bacterium]